MYATIGNIAKVKLSGDLGVSRHVHNKRAIQFYRCRANNQDIRIPLLEEAIDWARTMIENARHSIRRVNGRTFQQRYWDWFGGYTPFLRGEVSSNIDQVLRQFLLLQFKCYTINRPMVDGSYPLIYYGNHIFQQ